MPSYERYVAAACQFRADFLDAKASLSRMAARVEEAVLGHPDTRLVVFPECATTGLPGYGAKTESGQELREAFVNAAEPVPGPSSQALGRLAKQFGLFIATGFVEADPVVPGVIYNSSLLVGPAGEVLTVHRKVHTAGLFKAGAAIEVVDTPLGRLGLSICYDLWFPEFLRIQVLKGCVLHVNMTANQPVFGVGSTHVPVVRAAESGIYVVSANRCGDDRPQGGLQYMGASSIVGPLGQVLAMAGEAEETVYGEILPAEVGRTRAFLSTVKDRRTDLYCLMQPQLAPSKGGPVPAARRRKEELDADAEVTAG